MCECDFRCGFLVWTLTDTNAAPAYEMGCTTCPARAAYRLDRTGAGAGWNRQTHDARFVVIRCKSSLVSCDEKFGLYCNRCDLELEKYIAFHFSTNLHPYVYIVIFIILL